MKDEKSGALESLSQKIAFIESILFVSKEPVDPQKIMSFINCQDTDEFNEIITRMEERYNSDSRGITITRCGGGLQLVTRAEMHPYLEEFFTVRTSSKLSIPSLETLAIVAYRQPATLSEVSDLRGVNSIGPIKSLLQKKLIKISGRKKVPGLPLLYSTSREFLLYFGLNDLSELPSLEELTEMFAEKEQPSLFK
jgi:segregation and condensation protein B